MKQAVLSFISFSLAFILGVFLLRCFPPSYAGATVDTLPAETQIVSVSEEPTTAVEHTVPAIAPVQQSYDARFHLPVLCEGEVLSMSLERYVLGALLGEMPTSFEPDALKAQAVAIRTYALRQYQHRKHGAAAVCAEPGCCMNWVDPEKFLAQNGQESYSRALSAVRDTDAVAIYYQDEPICATFFSCACGRTEDASAVWGGEVPYLRSVESPDETAPYQTDTVAVANTEFVELLQSANEMAVFSADGSDWIGAATYTSGGGVETWELGGCIYTGMQLRQLFALRSTDFTIERQEDHIVFTTHGFGHRVGLSQYGANELAAQGMTFAEILQWYYSGVSIQKAENL